jgi:hypothetical protein
LLRSEWKTTKKFILHSQQESFAFVRLLLYIYFAISFLYIRTKTDCVCFVSFYLLHCSSSLLPDHSADVWMGRCGAAALPHCHEGPGTPVGPGHRRRLVTPRGSPVQGEAGPDPPPQRCHPVRSGRGQLPALWQPQLHGHKDLFGMERCVLRCFFSLLPAVVGIV